MYELSTKRKKKLNAISGSQAAGDEPKKQKQRSHRGARGSGRGFEQVERRSWADVAGA